MILVHVFVYYLPQFSVLTFREVVFFQSIPSIEITVCKYLLE